MEEFKQLCENAKKTLQELQKFCEQIGNDYLAIRAKEYATHIEEEKEYYIEIIKRNANII